MIPIDQEWLAQLPSYEPGRPIEEVARELGLETADDIVKLASNENALGPSPRAMEAMRQAAASMHLYPDGSSFYLRRALAHKLNVGMDNLVIGNGSNELIEFLGHVFLDGQSEVVMADRAFVIYKLMAMLFRAHTISVPMREFTHDVDAMRAAITPRTRLVFIANPNNPTGTAVEPDAIDRFVNDLPDHVLAVFDEAYVELLPPERQPDTLRYVREGRPVCVLRTFSKTYGLAGLRVGYIVAPPSYVALINRVRQPFNVNAMAQAAARAALEDDEHVARTRDMVATGLATLSRYFDERGLEYVPSCVNFILVRVGRGREVFKRLQREHVIVRPMDGYGLPDHIRVTVGLPEENGQFMRALDEVLEMGNVKS